MGIIKSWYGDAVPEASVEGRVATKEAENVLEACRLEEVRFSQDNLSVQRLKQAIRTHDDWAIRKLILALVDSPQILARGIGLKLAALEAFLPVQWHAR